MSQIGKLRKNVDIIDDSIIELLKRRFKVTKVIGDLKMKRAQELNEEFKSTDFDRESRIKKRLMRKFKECNNLHFKDTDDIFIDCLYDLIFNQSKQVQRRDNSE